MHIILAIGFVVLLVIGIMSPYLVIWLINSLFNCHTPYNLESWLAVVIGTFLLSLIVGGERK
jgi:hypothetical protein